MPKSQGRIILSGDPTQNAEWEGVIDDIKVESLPVAHITSLTLNLKQNKKTIIDVKSILQQSGNSDQAATRVNNIIKEHGELLISIDFKVDMSGLQRQVLQAKNDFTKKINKTIKRKNAIEKKKGKK
jgi:hypothetical protein